ncbi:MAG: hypothetical protein ABIG64_06480 [Candidatus Omnitrophota bacterium]
MKVLKTLVISVLLCSLVVPVYAAKKQTKSTLRIKKIAEPMIDNILKGFALDDYLIYSRDLAENLKVTGARTKFFQVGRNIHNNLGNYVDREFMGILNKQGMTMILWKANFDQTENDVLIKLVISRENKRYVVSGLWLQ